ncbi:hypothetical protein MUY21_03040 [Aliiroseovarius sp. S2029]|uniref:hypothetical protein n=1 Tax=Aliiroseovarius sp. S2029 TaxID=2936988 RepID=UPI0020BF6537|nr:hypothetical protein [Aliiroseovarius sp. S2029]MCK8483001.1 hypothetical protein [Aliiroseovarius sp. S2029]
MTETHRFVALQHFSQTKDYYARAKFTGRKLRDVRGAADQAGFAGFPASGGSNYPSNGGILTITRRLYLVVFS